MITYIIKFILCSGLLLLVYHVFLGNERFYRFNRFYLLFSLVFSLMVPFITINAPAIEIPYLDKFITPQEPIVVAPTEQIEPLITNELIEQQNTPAVITNKLVQQPVIQAPATDQPPYLLLGIYSLAVLILLARFAKNSWHINRLVAKSAIINYQDIKLVLIDAEVTPHSFLNYVFINKDAYQRGEVEPQVICHEQAHVRQLHTLDVIFVELLQVMFWFNPFIPFYRKAIQLNHEFLADEAVIESYQDTSAYQYLLLAKASQCGSLYLTSQFNYLITKKRLIMMTKNTSAKIALYKKVAMLPLLAAAIFLFSQKSTAAIENVKFNDGHKKGGVTVELNENDKPYLHLVTPTEWKNLMGAKSTYNNSKEVRVLIEKLNKKYHTDYRLPTLNEFDFFARKHPNLIKFKNTLVIIRGNINYVDESNSVALATQTPAQKNGKIVFTKKKSVRIQSKGDTLLFPPPVGKNASGLGEASEPVVLPDVKKDVVSAIKIVGEVRYPGQFTSKAEMSAQEWLTMAGGITSNGSVENVQIFRAGNRVNTDVVADAIKTILLPGDSIYVPRRIK